MPEIIIPAAPARAEMDNSYESFVEQLKQTIQTTRVAVTLQANFQLIMMYWQIGNRILEVQKNQGWGSRVIDRLSFDLRESFPDMKGFSASNLKNMRRFAQAWPDLEIGQQPVVQLPWGSNLVLLLLKEKNDMVVRYALGGFENPIGVAGWQKGIEKALPKELEDSLPTVDEIERELCDDATRDKGE